MEGYKNKAEKFGLVSCDYSKVKYAYIKDDSLFLEIDRFILCTNEEMDRKVSRKQVKQWKEDCLLVLEKFMVVDERASVKLISTDRLLEVENIAASRGISLYLSLEEFLRCKWEWIDVQDFVIDDRFFTLTGYVHGYNSLAMWCDLMLQVDRMVAYWNQEMEWCW